MGGSAPSQQQRAGRQAAQERKGAPRGAESWPWEPGPLPPPCRCEAGAAGGELPPRHRYSPQTGPSAPLPQRGGRKRSPGGLACISVGQPISNLDRFIYLFVGLFLNLTQLHQAQINQKLEALLQHPADPWKSSAYLLSSSKSANIPGERGAKSAGLPLK